MAIESNAIDVLRICLKYGCDPNEPGTSLKRALLNLDTNKFESHLPVAAAAAKAKQQTARFAVKCTFCLKKTSKIEKEEADAAATSNSTANNSASTSASSGPNRIYALHRQMYQLLLDAEKKEMAVIRILTFILFI